VFLPHNKIEFWLEIEVWLDLAYFKENRRCLANNNSLTILTAGVYRVRRRFVACSIANNIPRA
jgi:hypothetical protein